MKEITIDEMKDIQLSILLRVSEFCESNSIRYFLCGGTLLGAIRHKGFIPWDDDIDISMPRPDYERFISLFHDEKYQVFCWERDKHVLSTYAKVYHKDTVIHENAEFGSVLGVNIDVFPVDGLPNADRQIDGFIYKMSFLWRLIIPAVIKDVSKRSFIKRVILRMLKWSYNFFPINDRLLPFVIKEAKRYSFEKSEKVAVVVWGYGKKEVVAKDVATIYTKGEFEGHFFNIPESYNTYLSNLYGDYMELPPIEHRVNKHNVLAYWKEAEND